MIDDILERVRATLEHEDASLQATADAIVATGRAGGLVRPAGAGHSLASVMEGFFRAGGLAFVRPLWHERVLPLRGAQASTAAEREPGLGASVARAAGIAAEDTVVVFSNSGINPYPVEIAQVAAEAGAAVVAVTSRTANAGSASRAGVRLADIATIVIDTGVVRGDATWPLAAPVTAPMSSIANACIWTDVLRRVHDAAPDAGFWRSANVEGNDEFNRALVERFSARVPEL